MSRFGGLARKSIMTIENDDQIEGGSLGHALERMFRASARVLWIKFRQMTVATGPRARTKPTIPIIVKDKTSFYCQIVLAGARQAGCDLGVNVIELGTDCESDIDGQIRILANAVASIPAAIIIAPAQYGPLGKPIDNAAKKVKIVGIACDADSMAFTSFLGADNVRAGRLAADVLVGETQSTYSDTGGEVAIITSMAGGTLPDQRAIGFNEQIAEKYGAVNVVSHKVGDDNSTTGFNLMMELITDYPALRGVFASSLFMAKGAARAVAQKKANERGNTINLVGFDSDNDLVRLLQDGTIAALVVQDPFRIGYDGVKTALAASRDEYVPTHVDAGAHFITLYQHVACKSGTA
jgi:ribose transport system substrate-binding protein